MCVNKRPRAGAGRVLTLLSVIEVCGGLLLLFVGGEVLLRGAVGLAQRFGLSHLLIGLTVVAAATSMPELVVTVATGLQGVPDVGVGNVVGSNIANILLIMGTAALLFPIRTKPREMSRDSFAVLFATLIFVGFALLGTFHWIHGVVMLTLLVIYILYSYIEERRGNNASTQDAETAEIEAAAPASCPAALVMVVIGVGALVLGSELLVDGAVVVARAAGVSEAVIGLTLVAVGTSLPELATAIVAGIRHHSEVAVGNVLGSNLFNILAVLSALTFATPFTVPAQVLMLDLWVMTGATLLLFPVLMTGWRVGRGEGAFFLMLYVGYIAWQFQRMGPPTV